MHVVMCRASCMILCRRREEYVSRGVSFSILQNNEVFFSLPMYIFLYILNLVSGEKCLDRYTDVVSSPFCCLQLFFFFRSRLKLFSLTLVFFLCLFCFFQHSFFCVAVLLFSFLSSVAPDSISSCNPCLLSPLTFLFISPPFFYILFYCLVYAKTYLDLIIFRHTKNKNRSLLSTNASEFKTSY